MSALHLTGVTKRYGRQTVVDGLDLSVASGEFLSLLGPSGCGKTTLLRLIAGLTPCDDGSITVDGTDLTRVAAHRRNIGVVFQNYALFPHLTVEENIAFGLKAHGLPRDERAQRVRAVLQSVQLAALADRPVAALSGGQQQRVAVARALATRPRLILLDEPLSALDRKLREHMQIELRRILRDAGITAIFVTHDQDEALVMSDRIALMNGGIIEQLDVPEAIYAKPRTLFALNFVGLSSQFEGQVEAAADGMVSVKTPQGSMKAPSSVAVGSRVVLAVRPESICLGDAAPAGGNANTLQMKVSDTAYLGARRLIYMDTAASTQKVVAELSAQTGCAPRPGDSVALAWPVAQTLVFPAPEAA
ncbi:MULTISPECIES: ABC transporter ATP-binding protein [unclassified Achromobacter]|uniref:ABC transporter ATP-binding protein n=1 Tax=unclassified Achromobacter TaxID=2626865 RepID=UPI000B51E0AF|nr:MULTISPECIES: ABC transporter ATP-binding protein [unclassified Achromobacter]OWT79914.1 spermidine/putrescine ABC transporter ATP-binding protein [Achromobacter sp. HZ34]OWT81798.1 spermidine/putrescine ABC transporter ATP-binding protein [Achromobacter sp. HZ28]